MARGRRRNCHNRAATAIVGTPIERTEMAIGGVPGHEHRDGLVRIGPAERDRAASTRMATPSDSQPASAPSTPLSQPAPLPLAATVPVRCSRGGPSGSERTGPVFPGADWSRDPLNPPPTPLQPTILPPTPQPANRTPP